MKTRIHVVQGDITKLAVDVIVNAANPSLMGGGGVGRVRGGVDRKIVPAGDGRRRITRVERGDTSEHLQVKSI